LLQQLNFTNLFVLNGMESIYS